MLVGVGKFLMAVMYLFVGWIFLMVIWNPANSTDLLANWNFSGEKTIPFWIQWDRIETSASKKGPTWQSQLLILCGVIHIYQPCLDPTGPLSSFLFPIFLGCIPILAHHVSGSTIGTLSKTLF